MLRRRFTGPAVAALRDELVVIEGPDGAELLDLPDAPRPDPETPAPPRLLGMWESIVLAHRDRRRTIADAHRPHVVRRNGDTLPTVLVDGRVAGVWRATEDGVDVAAFEPLDRAAWSALEAEAHGLQALLADREPTVYRWYRRWWDTVPGAEVRRVAG